MKSVADLISPVGVEDFTEAEIDHLVAVLPNPGVQKLLALVLAEANGKMVSLAKAPVAGVEAMVDIAALQGEIRGMHRLIDLVDEAIEKAEAKNDEPNSNRP